MRCYLLAFAVGLALTGCALRPAQPTPKLGKYSFEYQIQDRQRVGLIQAFDDGEKTFLQFSAHDEGSPIVRISADAPALAYTWSGPYMILDGTYKTLLVSVGQDTVSVDNTNRTRPPTSQPQISEQLPKAGRNTDIIRFQDKRAIFDDKVNWDDMLSKALRADHIIITGFTDSDRATPGATRLAKARALSIRDAFIRRGLDGEKIRIAYFAARHFVDNNNTAEGRANNRRAEITFFDTHQVPSQ